jgi:hypothetical protein
MNCGWALPRAARLAAMIAVLSLSQAHAATPMVKFLAGTYGLTDTEGGGSHSLVITLPPGGIAEFFIDGDTDFFSMPDIVTPAGFYNGDSPYFTTDQLFTFNWDSVFWGYVTFYPLKDDGGLTIGSFISNTGDSNLIDTYAAPGSGQPFVIVGAPEPATWTALALGFSGLAFLRLRRPRDLRGSTI